MKNTKATNMEQVTME